MIDGRAAKAGLPSSEALFRFQVVSDVCARMMRGEVRADAVAAVGAYPHAVGPGPSRSVSDRTVYRWLAAFEAEHLLGLEPAGRERTTSSVVLPKSLLDFVAAQKKEDVHASLPELLKRARESGIVSADAKIDRTTLWRACQRTGVATDRHRQAKGGDSRRFAYPHRMQLILCDGKHFRAGATRAKRVAFFFLDDATRLGLHVIVGTSESKSLFLRGLYPTLHRFGRPGIVYIDRGAGFIADDTIAVVAAVKSLLIHGRARYPEGHGKIEKFNQTALNAILRNLNGRADVDPSLEALELRLSHWLRETYNHTRHEAFDGKQTPWERFSSDTQPLELWTSEEALRERFVIEEHRRVSKDHIIPIDSVHYEVPRGLAGAKIPVYRQVLDNTVRVLHQGRLIVVHPVDLEANARAKRGATPPAEESTQPLPQSAADLAFERAFTPVVGPDGGFPMTDDTQE